MEITKRPFTEKYPFQYSVTFEDGITISTTDPDKLDKVIAATNGETKFFSLPPMLRAKIEAGLTVYKPRA